ncbi:MAG: hypothetical protein IKY79_05240 [Bacteroidales bacterium]|nr:hypothetical protein [Bacteroidales bacterium]
MKDNDFEKLWNSGATARKYSQCSISDHELETIIGNAIERDNKTRKKHFPIWQKPYVYLAMVAACVAAVVVGLWQLRINSVLIPNTSEALQPSPTILVAQTTDMPVTDTPILHHHDDKPATITDNEIKNSADHTTNKHNQTRYAENEPATPQPDIIATTPIEQEHIPVLLAETETQIEIEQNLVADTAYMIADVSIEIERQLTELQMYCNTRCSSNEVSMMYFNTMGKI